MPASLPENSYIWSAYNSTADGFLIVGSFNEIGIAEGAIEAKIGKIREIRLHVHTDSENWAILSEVSVNPFEIFPAQISSNLLKSIPKSHGMAVSNLIIRNRAQFDFHLSIVLSHLNFHNLINVFNDFRFIYRIQQPDDYINCL